MNKIVKWVKIIHWGYEYIVNDIIERYINDINNPGKKIYLKAYSIKWPGWEKEVDEKDVILGMEQFLKTKTN